MSLLTLVRHGQSVYNLQNRFTGSVDVELTAFGREEARHAGIKLKGFIYHAAYTSTLKRAQETLAIILDEMAQSSRPITSNAALNERIYGSLQGLDKAETIAQYGEAQVELWRRSYHVRPPAGESLEDTYNRAVPYYIQTIAPALKAGMNILIVAHGNSLRALMMYLENLDELSITKVNIPTGTPKNYMIDGDLTVTNVAYI